MKLLCIFFLSSFPVYATTQFDYAFPFTKLLEHDAKTGLLTPNGQKNYQQLEKSLQTGKQQDFNTIERTKGTQRLFANPQAAFAHTYPKLDPESIKVLPPPALSSAQAAADLIELYVMAFCRDVCFAQYGTGKNTDSDGKGGSLTKTACKLLTGLGSAYPGNKKGDTVDVTFLFRGTSPGDLIGPCISQFLLQPYFPLFPSAPTEVGAEHLSKDILMRKRHVPILKQREFGVSWDDFIALQNGKIPKQLRSSDYDAHAMRNPMTGRDFAAFVYTDVSYDPYYYAINVLACNGFPYSKAFPYQKGIMKNEAAGPTMGLADVYSLIASVCTQAYKICWYYKWRVYRCLRPEAMAGLVHYSYSNTRNPFNLHESLFDKELLDLVLQHNQKQAQKNVDPVQLLSWSQASTYLLAQIYPEGSPIHPSYPAAHATIAGACITIIKAFFDDTVRIASYMPILIVDPAHPDRLKKYYSSAMHIMTVGSELDKLASNIAMGRSWAGLHFRSDNEAGLQLGEQIAIRYLQEHARMYHEECFAGFELTKRDGKRIRITASEVISL